MSRRTTFLVAAGLAAGTLSFVPLQASAFGNGRGSDNGDAFLNDEVRNPRFIEPGGFNDPARYRISNPRAGYEDRQLAARGYYNEGSGLQAPRPYRGRVAVTPYYAR